jgi:hypothetical protein
MYLIIFITNMYKYLNKFYLINIYFDNIISTVKRIDKTNYNIYLIKFHFIEISIVDKRKNQGQYSIL